MPEAVQRISHRGEQILAVERLPDAPLERGNIDEASMPSRLAEVGQGDQRILNTRPTP